MIKLNKTKILITYIILVVCFFFLFSKTTQVYAEEECEFSKNWTSNISKDYKTLTQIDFLKEAPVDYVDTNQTINTKIKVFSSSLDETKIAFVYNGVIKAPSDCTTLFASCTKVVNFNFENFDTSAVSRTTSMFSRCFSITSLDLSSFVTPNLLGTNNMFGECTNLSYLDISGLDTSNVVNMSSMFADCSSLSGSFGKDGTAVKIGENFKTEKVTTMQSMFSKCGKIISFDFGNFDFKSLGSNPNVTNGFFAYCAFNVLIAPKNIPEGIKIDLGGNYYDRVTNAQHTILDSSLAGRRLIKHNVHTPVDCVCTTCGFIDHNYGDWIEEIPAFCGKIGTKAHYHCDKCNKNFDKDSNEIKDLTIIATEHKYSEEWSNDSAYHWHECPCGLKNETAFHSYGEWVVTKAPTPTETGLKKRNCTVCNYEESEILYHTHSYSDSWNKNETKHWHECECGEKSEEGFHSYGEWVVTKAPTPTETGLKKRNCTVCNYEESEILYHTHSYSDSWNKDETKHWHECECGEKSEEGSHSYGEWVTITEASITAPGTKEKECTICGYKITETIPVIPHTHSYSDSWNKDENKHWHECECGEKNEEGSHSYGEWVTITEASITAPGTKEKECTICGYKITETIPVIPHTHIYSESWNKDENKHWHECECGEKSEEGSHSYGEWIVQKNATTKEEGIEERSCVCGKKETRSIQKLVGSSNNVGLIVGIVIPSIFVLCMIIYVVMYCIWNKKGKGLKIFTPSFNWIKNKIFKK